MDSNSRRLRSHVNCLRLSLPVACSPLIQEYERTTHVNVRVSQEALHTHRCRDVVKRTKFNKPVHDTCTHTFFLSASLVFSLFSLSPHTHTCLSEGFTCITHSTLNMPITQQCSCLCVVCELSAFL